MGELMHYGILGMKWGVRRDRGADGLVKKTPASSEYVQARQLKKKGLRSMTNAELKLFNERVNLEQQYKRLTKEQISTGRKFANEILRETGKELIKEAIKAGIKEVRKK